MYVHRAKSLATTMSGIQSWEAKPSRIANRKGCSIAGLMREGMRISIMMSMLPAFMEKEIKGHVGRFPTYAALRKRIEQDTVTQTTGPAPMINNTDETNQDEWREGDEYSENAKIEILNALIIRSYRGRSRENHTRRIEREQEREATRCVGDAANQGTHSRTVSPPGIS